ncbi:TPA: ATP-binding cassette domain-containing protein [Streptococcus pneumoniae]
MAMIEVEHLQKNFVKTVKEPGLKGALRSFIHPEKQTFEAVKDLTFEVPKGQILGFIGANGAGKSTTIKMLTGILKPTSGFCRINGKIPQNNRQDYVKDIGVVFGQRTQLWWDLALQETYTVLKEIYDVPDSLFHKRMDFLNEVLDLKDFIKDPVRTLSLGQRMRADIAASYLFTELGSKWLIFISVGLPFLSVIVLMKIISGQGIVEVLGLTVLYLFSLTLAYLINFFFNICFGFSAFVFKNLWGSNLLKTSIVAFMSGSLIPLAFFPKVVSDILSFLPFSSLIYTPVMIIVGKYDASQILQALLLQFFWLLVMVGLSQLIWKRVQSFITIQGG